ncbi:MAG: hypothetical protein SVY41_02325 [Candidatus Nanohaloarchaea archaeon]|nr:hypothetical protein [Candidatus Nanohaloarchaea archaeon]
MSVADEVVAYVEKRPYIQEALAQEIVNYSALARQIEDHVDGGFEAVKMALRRHAEELKDRRRERRTNVGAIMEGSTVTVTSNMQVCMADTEPDGDVVAATEQGFTAIQTDATDCPGETIDDQVLMTLHSPENIDDTSGVLAYVLSILAGREINITEFVSCREDTHFTVHEDDATEAFELLDEKLS